MDAFGFCPSLWIPFRDIAVLERIRKISRAEITQHPNPDFKITVHPDQDIEFFWLMDMFRRIQQSDLQDERLVMIMPNPYPGYRKLARIINQFKVSLRNVHIFNMDEFADEEGRIAPPTWRWGLAYSMQNDFYANVEPELRMPSSQLHGLTNVNLTAYASMIEDAGGADICYSGPGWTGHLAFMEPDQPEADLPLEQWKQIKTAMVTLSPFTLAQWALHGSFGMSGDLARVPPKAATIGPAIVLGSRHRLDINAITVHGTQTAWQRIMTRLVAHGPVTPKVPESILQTVPTDFWISESIARDIKDDFEKGY